MQSTCMFATQTLWGHMRLFTLILAALLYLPATVSAELGPESKKLIRNFSTEDELLYQSIVDQECFSLGISNEKHNELVKQRFLLRRIKPVFYYGKDVGRLKLETYTECSFSNRFIRIEVSFVVDLSNDSGDFITIGYASGGTMNNYGASEVKRELERYVDQKLSEFIGVWMEVGDLGSQLSVKQF